MVRTRNVGADLKGAKQILVGLDIAQSFPARSRPRVGCSKIPRLWIAVLLSMDFSSVWFPLFVKRSY